MIINHPSQATKYESSQLKIWWAVPVYESYQGAEMTVDVHWTQLLQAPRYCCMSHGWLGPRALGYPGTYSGCCSPPSWHPGCAQPTPGHHDISACQHHILLLRPCRLYYHLKQFNDSKSKFVPVLNQAPWHEGRCRYIAPCGPNLSIGCRSVGRFITCSIYALEKGCQCPMNKKLVSPRAE